MAKVLDMFAFRLRNVKYPWGEWEDGRIREATRGVDYHVSSRSFQAVITAHAAKLNRHVRTQTNEDTVVFQFYDKPET